jgi:acetyl esterase/lipase
MMIPFFYFVLSVFLLVNVLGVLQPRLFGQTLGLIGSVPFLLVSLMAPQLIVLSLFVTVLVSWMGGLSTPLGQLGLVVNGACWCLLLLHLLLMRNALPVLDGKPIRDDEPVFAGQPAAPLQVSVLPHITRRAHARRKVEILRNITYRHIDGQRLQLDVYRPRNRPAGDASPQLQSLIYIHGGAWIVGTRRQSPFLLMELAAAGYVVFAIQYRKAPRFPMPACIHDCKAAVAWVREHAPEYGGTPEAIALGGSAGGHLAAMLATSPNEPALQPGFESADTRMRGAVILYGIADLVGLFDDHPHPIAHYLLQDLVFKRRFRDDPAAFHAAQPITYLTKLGANTPPMLLIHGESDTLIPIEEAHRFHDRLVQAGAPRVHLCEMPHAVHAFELAPTVLSQRAGRVIRQFLDSLKEARATDAAGSTAASTASGAAAVTDRSQLAPIHAPGNGAHGGRKPEPDGATARPGRPLAAPAASH